MASSILIRDGAWPSVRKEGKATEAIRPGHVIEWDAGVGGGAVRRARSGGLGISPTRKAIALENDIIGRGVERDGSVALGSSKEDYQIGDRVQYVVASRGAEVQVWLPTGNNIAIGDPMVATGAGNPGDVKKAAGSLGADDEEIIGYCAVALNNATGTDALLRIEVA
jgi:hypothetical protein